MRSKGIYNPKLYNNKWRVPYLKFSTAYFDDKILECYFHSNLTIGNWIKDIRAKQKGTRNNLIYKLSFLGWTQQEIAEHHGLELTTAWAIVPIKNLQQKNSGMPSKRRIDMERLKESHFNGLIAG